MKTSEIEAVCHDHESRLALGYLLHRAERGEWTSEQFTDEFDANDILVAWQGRVSNMTLAERGQDVTRPRVKHGVTGGDVGEGNNEGFDVKAFMQEVGLNDNDDSVNSELAAFYDEYPYGAVEKRVHHENV